MASRGLVGAVFVLIVGTVVVRLLDEKGVIDDAVFWVQRAIPGGGP